METRTDNYNGALQQPVGSGFDAASTARDVIQGINLSGKTAIVTGGYSGIGVETVKALATAGATVYVPARTKEKAEKNLAGIPNVTVWELDLMDPASINAFADQFLALNTPLHLLINNAGIMWTPLRRDARGYESQFSTNHLGHFQLTARLWPALKSAKGARVVNVSSWGHQKLLVMSEYWTAPEEIMLPCIEDKYFKFELLSGDHTFGRLISGEVKVNIGDQIHILKPGDTWFCPRNQLATFIKYAKDGQPYKSVTISLRAERLKDYYTRHAVTSEPRQHCGIKYYGNHPLLESFFGSLLPYFEMEKGIPPEIVTVKMDEAITVLRIPDPSVDRCLANFSEPGKIDLADFMEKNFMFNMPLQKFAYFTGRSLTTFKTDFKKAFDLSPQRWLTQKRLELAHYQLLEKNRKPADIYLETGFENLSHFSFAFKKHFGYSPTEVIIRNQTHAGSI